MTGATAAALIVSTIVICATAIAVVWIIRFTSREEPERGRRPSPPETWETLLRGLETRVKALETEWEDFYSKSRRALSRLGGEKRQQVDEPRSPDVSSTLTRADLLRRARAKRGGSDV